MPLNLFLRRRSFLESSDWLHVPWSDGCPKDLMDHAVDTLVFIPGLLAETDRVRVEGATTKRLHAGVSRVIDALNMWRLQRLPQHYAQSPGRKPVTLESVVQDLSDGSLTDASAAQAVVLHLSNWLLLTRLEPIYIATLPWSITYLTESILDIAEEFSYRQSATGVLPWTTAIRVALFTHLHDQDRELTRARGRDLCVRVEARYSTRMLSDIIASLPGTDEKLKFDE